MQIGIGEWKMRNGNKVSIFGKNPFKSPQPWVGSWADLLGTREWCDDGFYDVYRNESPKDIISPWTSPVATGHNPDKLTEEQVGVKDGWRLLDEDEIVGFGCGYERLGHVDCWSCGQWQPGNRGICNSATYRTRLSREELAELGKPKKRLIRVEELPPVCWIDMGNGKRRLANGYDMPEQKLVAGGNHVAILVAKDKGWQWSSDLKNWNPFEVEEK